MQFEIDTSLRKSAKWPHEVFLINLITNHVLVFVGLLGLAGSFPAALLVVPGFSLVTLLYILTRAKKMTSSAPWFIACHWQVAARRSRIFILMLAIMAAVIVAVVLMSDGHLRPQHWALAGGGVLPTMLTVLVLIVMEQDAMHQANSGLVPQWVIDRFPPPPEVKVIEE